jgi:hypothetical protein
MFGYELVEEVVIDVTFHKSSGKGLKGTLCRTSCGVRFIVEREVYLALDNEEIDTVECHSLSAIGCSPWKNLGCKALAFKKLDSVDSISFAVTNTVAKSWVKHFYVG